MERRPVGFIFLHIFHLIKAKFHIVMKVFKLKMTEIHVATGKNYCFTDCIIKLKGCHALGASGTNFVQTRFDDRLYCILELFFVTMTLIESCREVKKKQKSPTEQKTENYIKHLLLSQLSQSFQSI